MTTFNTGNPIGSTDARDRSDNSENLDLAVNSLSQTFVDRLGVTRDTLEGIYQKSAYYRAGTFDAGYTLTNNRQTLAYGNVEYSWSGAFPKVVSAGSTPETSGGVGSGGWIDRTQDTIRSNLSSNGGSRFVFGAISFVSSVADIVNSATGTYIEGQRVYTQKNINWYDCEAIYTIKTVAPLAASGEHGYQLVNNTSLYAVYKHTEKVNLLICGCKDSLTEYSNSEFSLAVSIAGASGLPVYNPSAKVRTNIPTSLDANKTYRFFGDDLIIRRVTYPLLSTTETGVAAIINTESNLFSVGANTVVVSQGIAWIGSEAARSYGVTGVSQANNFFIKPVGSDYFKVNFEWCAVTGFWRAFDFTNGSYAQNVSRCKLENNDLAIKAPTFCNASHFDYNSWIYNRIHFTGIGVKVSLTHGEFAFDASYDENGIVWQGSGHNISDNYMEILVKSNAGVTTNVVPIRWIVSKFDDRRDGVITRNRIDNDLKSNHHITIGSSHPAETNASYCKVYGNALIDSVAENIAIDTLDGGNLQLPDLSNYNTTTISGSYLLVTDKASAYIDSTGAILSSTWYNIGSIVKNSTGNFTITFANQFRHIPVITASGITGGSPGYSLSGVSASGFTIKWFTTSTLAAVDINFMIKAESNDVYL